MNPVDFPPVDIEKYKKIEQEKDLNLPVKILFIPNHILKLHTYCYVYLFINIYFYEFIYLFFFFRNIINIKNF